jgi:hypothetical protein
MILTHESGAQEDQFDEKKRKQKISWYYPFKEIKIISKCLINEETRQAIGSMSLLVSYWLTAVYRRF